MIITISGSAGSGKSTIAQRLAEELKWNRYYIGGIRREAAKKRGLTLAEYNKLGETNPETDVEVDKYQEELGKKEDNFIIEGRTSWYFIPHSLKIYFAVSPEEGSRRIFSSLQVENQRNEDKNLETLESVLESIKKRQLSDNKRYRQYYDIDVNDQKNYDFYLDTTNLSREEVFAIVLKFIKDRLDNEKK